MADDARVPAGLRQLKQARQKPRGEEIVVAQHIHAGAERRRCLHAEAQSLGRDGGEESLRRARAFPGGTQDGQREAFSQRRRLLGVSVGRRDGADAVQKLVGGGETGRHMGILRGVQRLHGADLVLALTHGCAVIECSEVYIIHTPAAQARLEHMGRGAVDECGFQCGDHHAVERIRVGGAENI